MDLKPLISDVSGTLSRLCWPEICPFCGRACAGGICPACREKLTRLSIREPYCLRCGKPLQDERQAYCLDCREKSHLFTRGRALWVHQDPVRSSLYQFKYHNQRAFAKIYAREMVRAFGETVRVWRPQVLLPVPLHPKRQRARGYNQAQVLAEEMGALLSLPVVANGVARIENTRPQKTLGARERHANLSHAFAAEKAPAFLKRVLVIDDIYTTGSTIDGVARALRNAGVGKIYFLTISIGQGY